MVRSETLAAARSGFAVGPVLAPAVLELTGKDARDYLHRMSTQDLARLAPGEAAYAAFLDAKGRLLGEGHVVASDDRLFVVVDRAAGEELRAHLDRFVIMDDVVVADRSDAYRVVPVFGEAPLGAALRYPNARRGAPCLDLLVPEADAERVRAEQLSAGAVAVDEEALEALRVLAGIARWGAELDPGRLPMEAGLTGAAISFTKGCYIGQEIVVRATARGQLQRGLVRLALPEGAAPGAKLAAGGVEAGVLTSAVDAPEGRVGLGYLRRAHWAPGSRVTVGPAPGQPEGRAEATVLEALAEKPDGCAA